MTPEILVGLIGAVAALMTPLGVLIGIIYANLRQSRKTVQEVKRDEVELLRGQLVHEITARNAEIQLRAKAEARHDSRTGDQRVEAENRERRLVQDYEARLGRRDAANHLLRKQIFTCQERLSLALSILDKHGLEMPSPRRRSDLTGPLSEYDDPSGELPALRPLDE